MQTREDYLETGFPSQYKTFSQIYTSQNPYVPTNYLQAYPMYIAPEFGKYYSNPLRGPQYKNTINSLPQGTDNLNLMKNYEIGSGWNMLGGGQEAMQDYPSYPYMDATTAYENDYYFTNNNMNIGDVYNDQKSLEAKARFDLKNRKKLTVNQPIQYRDPQCMTQDVCNKCGDKVCAVKYPTEIERGMKKCGCF